MAPVFQWGLWLFHPLLTLTTVEGTWRDGPQFMLSKWMIWDVCMISSTACLDHQYPWCCSCSQFSRGLILCHFISALVWLLLKHILVVKKTDRQLLTDERVSCIRHLILQNDNRWYDRCICMFCAEWQSAAAKKLSRADIRGDSDVSLSQRYKV